MTSAFWTSRRRDIVAIGGLAAVSAAVLVSAARLDPDPYHDGAQMAPAVAVAEGLAIHRDVFNQYGPITTWLHALAIDVFGPTLLVIRLEMALLLVVSAMLLFAILRLVRVPTMGSVALALSWVAMWPGQAVIWGTPLQPWPSVTFLVLQLVVVLLLVVRVRAREPHPSLAIAVGALSALAVVTRTNYGVPMLVAVIIALVILRDRIGISRREVTAGVMAMGVVWAIIALILASQSALRPYLDQAILAPLSGDASQNISPWVYLKSAYLWGILPLLGSLGAVWLLGRLRPSARVPMRVAGGLALVGLTVWASTALETSPLRTVILERLTWAPALDVQAQQPLFLTAVLTTILTLAFVVRRVSGRYFRATGRDARAEDPAAIFVVLALVGSSSLVQLFPIADPNHLWWAAPVPLALVVMALHLWQPREARNWLIALLTVPYLIVAVGTGTTYFGKPRVAVDSGVLTGMLIPQELTGSVTAVDTLLNDLPPAATRFVCPDGLFAVWTGRYLSDSASWVDWSFGMDRARPDEDPAAAVICTELGQPLDPSTAPGAGMTVVDEARTVILSYFTQYDLYRLSAQPIR